MIHIVTTCHFEKKLMMKPFRINLSSLNSRPSIRHVFVHLSVNKLHKRAFLCSCDRCRVSNLVLGMPFQHAHDPVLCELSLIFHYFFDIGSLLMLNSAYTGKSSCTRAFTEAFCTLHKQCGYIEHVLEDISCQKKVIFCPMQVQRRFLRYSCVNSTSSGISSSEIIVYKSRVFICLQIFLRFGFRLGL